MKYRKKPIVVDAVQLRWDTWSEMCDHAGVGKLTDGKPSGVHIGSDGQPTENFTGRLGLAIPTKEGLMVGMEGDWIIKGVAGEIYPCKPDIFDKTYERVTDEKENKK